MVRAVDGEFALSPFRSAVLYGTVIFSTVDRPLLGAVAVGEAVALLRHRLEVLVDVVDAARRVHPAGALVEALVDEELSPGQRAVRVQPFVAGHLRFGRGRRTTCAG